MKYIKYLPKHLTAIVWKIFLASFAIVLSWKHTVSAEEIRISALPLLKTISALPSR